MKFLLLSLLFFSLLLQAEFNNALKAETSPYLQQHAQNPVNWYAWNDQSLAKAKKEHKLIFLSIGYSTCHWCHVMAHESFENKKIAELLNRDYISIKVDREELPHLDKYYQNLHIFLKKRSGGWPLNAVWTEDAKAFYIATYIPPSEKYNIEGLDTLLPSLAKAYKKDSKNIFAQASKIQKSMKSLDSKDLKPVKINIEIKDKVFKGLQEQFDKVYYGFSIQPKFPEASKISLLFDLDAMGVKGAKEMALQILDAMALHGLYDQVEGGFFRYSVDAAWEIPHFEKMLYTNAELIPLYVKAYKITKDELYKRIVDESIEMIENRFVSEGLYFSASDADSSHGEGGYYIYTYNEMIESMKNLNTYEQEELIEALDFSEIGNFINESEDSQSYTHLNFYTDRVPKSFDKIKKNLQVLRSKREYPFIDKKINTAWNAMMIEALFLASDVDEKYLVLAEKRVFLLLEMMYTKGVLYHQSLVEKQPKQKALLEDYAFLISALIQGYEKNYNTQYLHLAKVLSNEAIEKLYDGKFWYLSDDSFEVYADMQDRYYKAAVSKLLISFVKLASLDSQRKYLLYAQEYIQKKSSILKENPADFASTIQILLREKRGYVSIKAKKENLQKAREKIENVHYPFVLSKADEGVKTYLACDMLQCFAIEDDITKLIEEIEKR